MTNLEAARANAREVLCRASRKLEATEKHNSVVNKMVVKHLDDIDSLLDLYSSGSKNSVDWLIRVEHELEKVVLNALDETTALGEMNRLVQEKKEHLACILQKYNVPYLLQALNEGVVSCSTN